LWCGGGHLPEEYRRRGTHLQHRNAASASWRKERKFILLVIKAAGIRRRRCERGSRREQPKLQRDGVSFFTTPRPVLRGGALNRTERAVSRATQDFIGRSSHDGPEGSSAFAAATTGDASAQQIMTVFSVTLSEKSNILTSTKKLS
jgi:hypothetical protein